jgi:hypothetical protein
MRSDSDIGRDVEGELRWESGIHTADNAVAVQDWCPERQLLARCVLIAISVVLILPQHARVGAAPEPIAEVVAKVKPAVVEVIVVRPKNSRISRWQRS